MEDGTIRISRKIGREELILETGELAVQANGAVLVQWGGITVLCTCQVGSQIEEEREFVPLLVDWEEKLYARGKIPGSFFRREGRPGERAILTARRIDRILRPRFPKSLRREVQVVATALSTDQQYDPDIAAIIGSIAAVTISEVPFEGKLSAVRVGRVGGEFILNPNFTETDEGTLNLVVALDSAGIVMLECEGKEVNESVILDAIEFARPYLLEIIALMEELQAKAGKPKFPISEQEYPEEISKWLEPFVEPMIQSAWSAGEKFARDEIFRKLDEQVRAEAAVRFPDVPAQKILALLEDLKSRAFRKKLILGQRPDGRKSNEIRPIRIRTGFLPRVHGSALFQRGLTQVLTTCTLGKPSEQQMIEDLSPEAHKRYLHQYNFPGYATGEVKPLRSPGRREIGHGALAERALEPVIPPLEKFPYTLRVVSEVTSSNGSTSMASVCGSTLALMDAGVPLKRPVSGISIGLVSEDDAHQLLTDIQGIEDAYGDMDFKVAGTIEGITAIQLDIKKLRLPIHIIQKALEQAKQARLFILQEIEKVLPAPKPELSPYAPRILGWKIPKVKIGDLIGPGGKHIRAISEGTGVTIDVEEDGQVYFTGDALDKVEKALKLAKDLVGEVEPGQVFPGKVRRIFQFGLLVEVMPGKVGLVHISEIPRDEGVDWRSHYRPGDEVRVRVLDVNHESGRISLSMKGLTGLSRRKI